MISESLETKILDFLKRVPEIEGNIREIKDNHIEKLK